jgi:uncharacterized Tic20 family protein
MARSETKRQRLAVGKAAKEIQSHGTQAPMSMKAIIVHMMINRIVMGVKCDIFVLTSSNVIVIFSFIASHIVDIVLTIFTIIITTIFGLVLYEFGGFRYPMSCKEMLADVAQGLSSAATSLSESLKLGALCH